MQNVITNPIANIPKNAKSHTRGWAMAWADRLDADLNEKCDAGIQEYDTVYVDHGVNFHGSLNMFGGANKEVFDKINNVLSHKNVVSLDWDMPDYGALFKKRLHAATTYEGITPEWCDHTSTRISAIPTLRQEDHFEGSTGLILGDSHSLAFSRSKDRILRNDGATLYGALKAGIHTMFRGIQPEGDITLCFGSIDIRHHILRHTTTVEELVDAYVEQGRSLESTYDCTVSYAAPVPVEFEGRRIPKTGWFEKAPFYGSQSERADITTRFIARLVHNGVNVVHPPVGWYGMDPEEYATTYMEFGGSFHIAPPFYCRNNWGQ